MTADIIIKQHVMSNLFHSRGIFAFTQTDKVQL